MRNKKARLFILDKLTSAFGNTRYYHSVSHALEVEKACKLISDNTSQISDIEKDLLSIAALCHDIGYNTDFENHEQVSVNFVVEHLGEFGYSENEINIISELIFSTKFPHNPKNILEEIICDADLSYLGGDNYFDQVEKLKLEFDELDIKIFKNEKDWIEFQLNFLKKHIFYTDFANKNYLGNKNEIVEKLKSKL